jgi:DNA polymerase-3 subunit delta'
VQFKDVIGQAEVKQQLIDMYLQNRLGHALLFLGKEGSGALSLARAFTQYINCEKVNGKSSQGAGSLFGEAPQIEAGPHADSCGICPSCLRSSGMINPDIHFSFPVITKKSGEKPVSADYISEWREFIKANPYGNIYDWLQFIKADNKQGNITSAECNHIIKTLSLKSFGAEFKFLIMWTPEFLGNEGNKLLKIIEEPPPNTIFIFVAENDQLILPTILSRTQLIKIPRISTDDIKSALIDNVQLKENEALQIAILSEGNFREALQQVAHNEDNWEVQLRDWLNTILKTGPAEQVKWIEDISKLGREKQKQFLRYFNHLLEHAIRLRFMGDEAADKILIKNEKQDNNNDFANRFNKLCNVNQQEAIIKELDVAIYHIERNANTKILFHALTIKIYHIISNKSVILVS